MEVKGLVWVGTRTAEYDATVRFFRDELGLRPDHTQTDFAVFRMPNGDTLEVFGPSDTDHAHFDSGPVVGFLVDDVAAARAELEEAGTVDLLGPLRSWPGGTASQHFRAPDGNVYEVLGPMKEADG
ncbi:MAG: VOC family protein [Chloroflexota bacterium]|nr:VOC family protein [Chloroflexota bacterium]